THKKHGKWDRQSRNYPELESPVPLFELSQARFDYFIHGLPLTFAVTRHQLFLNSKSVPGRLLQAGRYPTISDVRMRTHNHRHYRCVRRAKEGPPTGPLAGSTGPLAAKSQLPGGSDQGTTMLFERT